MRRRLRKKKRQGEFREFGIFIEVSLADGDTTTLLEDFQAQAIAPHRLEFRGRIVQRALSGFVELGHPGLSNWGSATNMKPIKNASWCGCCATR